VQWAGPAIPPFYHLHLHRLKLFRDPEKEIVLSGEPEPIGSVIWLAPHRREVVQCKRGNVLVMKEGPYRRYGVPPIRKELPMEFTASVTALMAIVSFGFLAAILLGMI
jgi:hypothetical protein